jgi:hypothetical protein
MIRETYSVGQRVFFIVQKGFRVKEVEGTIVDADTSSDVYAVRGDDGNAYLIKSKHIRTNATL